MPNPSTPEPTRPAIQTRSGLALAALVALVVLAILRSWMGTRLDGLTLDEPYHLLAAVAYAEDGAYQLNPEHPPLVKRWVGETVAPIAPLTEVPRPRNKLEERNAAERFVYLEHDARQIQQRARLAMIGFHGVLLLLVLALVRDTFGTAWAVVAGGWLALDPTVGAHLPVVMTDLPLALMLTLTALVAARALDAPDGLTSWIWAGTLGIATGLTAATKHSALAGLLTLLLYVLVAGVRSLRRQGDGPTSTRPVLHLAGRLLVVVLLAQLALWSQYGFRRHAAADGSDPFHRTLESKIEEVGSPVQRTVLHLADGGHLAPRAYLWGLADTLRAGVEGRGQDRHVLFGRVYEGSPPWFFWPGILASKIPLPQLLLALLGVAAGVAWPPSGPLPGRERRALWALGAMGAGHFLALASSGGTYGGIRHALPLLVLCGVLAGGVVRLNRSRWPRGAVLVPATLLVLTLATTAGEVRLWEYHNALAGGTEGAAERFDNEGVWLGQRLPEVARLWHGELGAANRPLYALLPIIEEEAASLGLPLRRRVADLYDTNRQGGFEGFFLVRAGASTHQRHWGDDLAQLEPVARLGNVELLAGRIESPQLRASGLLQTVGEYLNQAPRPDWATLALRMEELVDVRPDGTSGWILLGNCRVALRQRPQAVDAFEHALDTLREGDPARSRIRKHLDLVKSAALDEPLPDVPFLPIVSAE